MADIFTIAILFLIIGAIFFYFFIFPTILFIDCIKSKIKKGLKTIWVISMILIWPIPHYLFGTLYSEKFSRRMISTACLALTLLLFLGTAFLIPHVQKLQVSDLQATFEKLEDVNMPGTVPGARDRVLAAIRTLQGETSETWFYKMSEMEIAGDLHEILKEMIKDNQLTSSEYQSFIEKFRTRDLLDHEALQDFLEELR